MVDLGVLQSTVTPRVVRDNLGSCDAIQRGQQAPLPAPVMILNEYILHYLVGTVMGMYSRFKSVLLLYIMECQQGRDE